MQPLLNGVTQAASSGPGDTGSLIHWPGSYLDRLDLRELFERSQPLELELGSGDGGFMLRWAGQHPDRNFLAVERLMGRLRKIDRKGRRLGLRNLRGLRIEAGYFLEYMFPLHAAEVIHIYFPDPWPKRKHRKNRLVNEHFADVAAQALVPGGQVYLRTDDWTYHAQMEAVFGAHPAFTAVDTPAGLRAVLTDFEQEFLAKGVAGRYAAFEVTIRPAVRG